MFGMRRLVLLVLLLISTVGFGAEPPKPQIRFGELLISVEGWKTTWAIDQSNPKGYAPGFHAVEFHTIAKNVGSHALCTSLFARIEATFGVNTKASVKLEAPEGKAVASNSSVRQLLPGEQVDGVILSGHLRDGVDPVTLTISTDNNQGCNSRLRVTGPTTLRIPFSSIPKLPKSE
jgi:hypothetical protein